MSGNDIVERAFKEWSQKGVCEISGKFSWIDAQQMMQESLVRDGEILIKHIRNADNRFGYAIQFLEPDYLDEEYNVPAKNGNRVVMGVELNHIQQTDCVSSSFWFGASIRFKWANWSKSKSSSRGHSAYLSA